MDGRPALRLTASPTSPTWSEFHVAGDGLGSRLLQLALAGATDLLPTPSERFERSQEVGRSFELEMAAAIVAGCGRLALYQPAPDDQGPRPAAAASRIRPLRLPSGQGQRAARRGHQPRPIPGSPPDVQPGPEGHLCFRLPAARRIAGTGLGGARA
ncbi:MAG: hypothetical protein JF888_07845 [Candidatus Dormibacteraeota bacterium]|uniref:Uncharacterized protein n=1 Tax=Candidatus Dormiibacter inghamiae TaxID=3127013 RepID=A0A934KI27_9BACT|nr:hypothetical protein [Candidatus Dormibacteraeota bacterium]MBJ7606931.1 hypothetical protein [Candidatus Dormibacteraeota bacterium]